MRSRVNWRISLERGARLLAIATLAWALARAMTRHPTESVEWATSATLRAHLARWSTVASPSRVHVDLAAAPDGEARDWLAALGRAATTVEWSGRSLVPTAIQVDPRADPVGGADISVAAPDDSLVVVTNAAGTLDSVRAVGTGAHASVLGSRGSKRIDARTGVTLARGAVEDSLVLKRLLVIGAASWETKFTVAALEERGWTVDAIIEASPTQTVRQGTAAAIDTAVYSAILAIDTSARPFSERVARFVKAGGGLVLWSPAARAGGLAAIAPGRPGTTIEDADSALTPIVSLVPDALVLDRRGSAATVVARRMGLGRIIETGYTTSWRWRMAGGDEAVERHRAWLAGLVAAVAYTGRQRVTAPPTDVAPLATLIDRLGPAAGTRTGSPMGSGHTDWWV